MGAEAATDLSRIAEIRDHPILSPGTATLDRSIASLEKAPDRRFEKLLSTESARPKKPVRGVFRVRIAVRIRRRRAPEAK